MNFIKSIFNDITDIVLFILTLSAVVLTFLGIVGEEVFVMAISSVYAFFFRKNHESKDQPKEPRG